jgi:predicted SprT family Zn-dependent metalloprotease
MKTRQVRKLLHEYIKWWVHWTGLGFWNIQVEFKYSIKKRPNGQWLCGITTVDWRYLTTNIVFYPKAMRHLKPDEIEHVVIHELMHVFLNEVRESGIDHEERVASMLQKAFSWVRGASREEVK